MKKTPLMTHLKVGVLTLVLLMLLVACQNNKDMDLQDEDKTQSDQMPVEEALKPQNTLHVLPYFEMQDDLQVWGFITTNGDRVIEPRYLSLQALEGSDYFKGQDDTGFDLLDPYGQVVWHAEDHETFTSEWEAYRVDVSSGLSLYFDDQKGLYGYEDKVRGIKHEAMYAYAEDYLDGYAVVQVDPHFETYQLINEAGQVVFDAGQMPIAHVGYGFVSAVLTPNSFMFDYELKALFSSEGNQLTEALYYQIMAINDHTLLVTDQTKAYFINEKGEPIDPEVSLPFYESYSRMHDVVVGQTYIGQSWQVSYFNDKGHLIWSSNDGTVKHTDEEGITYTYAHAYLDHFLSVEQVMVSGLIEKTVSDRVNATIKQGVADRIMRGSDPMTHEETSYRIDVSEEWVSVVESTYTYPIGAAHGSYGESVVYFDRKTAQALAFDDLFKSPQAGKKSLEDMLMARVQYDENAMSYWIEPGCLTPSPLYYQVTKEGLTLVFQLYEIGPYVIGMPSFEFPFVALLEILDLEGPWFKGFDIQMVTKADALESYQKATETYFNMRSQAINDGSLEPDMRRLIPYGQAREVDGLYITSVQTAGYQSVVPVDIKVTRGQVLQGGKMAILADITLKATTKGGQTKTLKEKWMMTWTLYEGDLWLEAMISLSESGL